MIVMLYCEPSQSEHINVPNKELHILLPKRSKSGEEVGEGSKESTKANDA